jgi:hypothetical protein
MATRSFTVTVAAWLICLSAGTRASEAAALPDAAPPADTTATARPEANEPLDEIIVRGTRLWQMRKAITDVDDQFFARYNEINKKHDFDVHCAMEAPLGTRLEERVCRAAFQEKAEQEWARALLVGPAAIPPEVVRLLRQDEYRENLLAVVRADPQLMQLVRQREALGKKYEAARKKRMNGRWVLFD